MYHCLLFAVIILSTTSSSYRLLEDKITDDVFEDFIEVYKNYKRLLNEKKEQKKNEDFFDVLDEVKTPPPITAKREATIDVKITRDPEACLHAVNQIREQWHDTTKLVWDETLAYEAEKHAIYMSQIDKLVHSNNGNGENVYRMHGAENTCQDAVLDWYNGELKYFDFEKMTTKGDASHLTQLIWKGTTKVGFGVTFANGVSNVVARFSPPGNTNTDYAKYINKPIKAGKPTSNDITISGVKTDVHLTVPNKHPVCNDDMPDCASQNCAWVGDYCKKSCGGCNGPNVDGSWTEWTQNKDCSSKCEHVRMRFCISPAPFNEGSDCQGPSTEHVACNTCPCVDNDPYCPSYAARGDCPKYPEWAKETCQKSCKICTSICADKSAEDCPDRKKTYCNDPTYTMWAEQVCPKLCGRC